jgi:hypothetical protein
VGARIGYRPIFGGKLVILTIRNWRLKKLKSGWMKNFIRKYIIDKEAKENIILDV